MFGEDLGAAAPINPSGWSVTGELTVPAAVFVPVPPNEKTIGLQQEFKEAGMYTLDFDIIKKSAPAAGVQRSPRATAIIEFSVAGNTITREVDLSNAVSISGLAQAVRVTVSDTTPFANLGVEFTYEVRINLAPGVRPVNPGVPLSPASFTEALGPGLTSHAIPVNKGINAVAVIPGAYNVGGPATPTDVTSKVLTCTITDTGGNVLANFNPMPGVIAWIPMPPGAVALNLQFNAIALSALQITVFYAVGG